MKDYTSLALRLEQTLTLCEMLIGFDREGMKAELPFYYNGIRESLQNVLNSIHKPTPETLDAWDVTDWTLIHMIPLEQIGTPTIWGPHMRRLDPAMRHNAHDMVARARWVLDTQQQDLMRAARRLRALAVMEGEPTSPGRDTSGWMRHGAAAERLLKNVDQIWSKATCKREISDRCNDGRLDCVGKKGKWLINPISVDALALEVRNRDLERYDRENQYE